MPIKDGEVHFVAIKLEPAYDGHVREAAAKFGDRVCRGPIPHGKLQYCPSSSYHNVPDVGSISDGFSKNHSCVGMSRLGKLAALLHPTYTLILSPEYKGLCFGPGGEELQ